MRNAPRPFAHRKLDPARPPHVLALPAQLGSLAAVLGMSQVAAPGLEAIGAALHELGRDPGPRRRTLCFIWRDPWMAVGGETYAGDLLRRCGADNLALQIPGRYPRAPLDTFLALQPELILLPSEPYAFAEADRAAFTPFAAVPAVRDGRILLCDGMALTWPGPRTLEAVRDFGAVLRA